MPIIFLSPSLQPFNEYVGGGNEQQYMNEVAEISRKDGGGPGRSQATAGR